jgi:predicted nucleotidyltransferase
MSLKPLMQSRSRIRVLSLLLLGGQERYYVREIERRTGENINSVRRELANLERAGLVNCVPVANLKYYSISRSSPLYHELRSMFLKTEGIAGLVREKLARHGDLNRAFIFGSFATGDEKPSSDIDIFLVGNIDEKTVLRNVKEIEDFLGRQVNYISMSLDEFHNRIKKKDPFVSRILASPMVSLVEESAESR